MRPFFTRDDAGNVGLGYPVGVGDCLLRSAFHDEQSLNLNDVSGGQSRVSVAFPGLVGGAILSHHVRGVVLHRSEKQMRRVDARRVVAAMEHAHPCRNRPAQKRPGRAMGSRTSDLSMSESADSALPKPAATKARSNDRTIPVDSLKESTFPGQLGDSTFAHRDFPVPLTKTPSRRRMAAARVLTHCRAIKRAHNGNRSTQEV